MFYRPNILQLTFRTFFEQINEVYLGYRQKSVAYKDACVPNV